MSVQSLNPESLGEAPLVYTHGILVEGNYRTLYVSGQVGANAKGECAADFATQARQVWSNLEAVLKEAGMSLENVVKTTTFLVDRKDAPVFAEVRKEVLNGAKPASSFIYVGGLAKPEWTIEIEAIAVSRI